MIKIVGKFLVELKNMLTERQVETTIYIVLLTY